jgi:hypothetical protein
MEQVVERRHHPTALPSAAGCRAWQASGRLQTGTGGAVGGSAVVAAGLG